MEKNENHRCPVCGKPVNQKSEICQRTTAAGRKGEYRRWHSEMRQRVFETQDPKEQGR